MPAKWNGRPPVRPIDELKPPGSGAVTLLTVEDLCKLLQVSRSTIERLVRSEPLFPQPRRFGRGRLIRFVESEVQEYLTGLPTVEYSDHGFDPNAPREMR